MSWTRLDDMWTESTELEALSFADRWHYLCMIQHCSRTGKVDGIMRQIDARRCSDHHDPDAALKSLVDEGLVKVLGSKVQVLRIDDHIPPPSVRNRTESNRVYKQRQRKHQNGDHSMCLSSHCDHAPSIPVSADVSADSTDDPRTGQDRTGQDQELSPNFDSETGEIFDSEESGASVSASTPDSSDSTAASGRVPSITESPEHRAADPFGSTSSSSASSASSADGPASVDFNEFVQQFRNPGVA